MDKEEEIKNINFLTNNYLSLEKDKIINQFERVKSDSSSNEHIIHSFGNIFPGGKSDVKRRRRIKNNYNKIKNNSRQRLIEMVNVQGLPLRDAAMSLGINYSTAKSIFRIYKLENRINKKNSVDEIELKNAYFKLKNEKEKKPPTNNNKNNLSSLNFETSNFLKHQDSSINENDSNNVKGKIDSLNEKINQLKSNVNSCFDMIIDNQNNLQSNYSNMVIDGSKFFNLESK
jgi:hypothetical protein